MLDVRDAMRDDAPLLHDDLVTESLGKPTGKHSNIAKHFQFKLGDVAKGFAQAAVVVEREFHTATVHQGYIEPHNATALWNADGTRHHLVQHARVRSRCGPRSPRLLAHPGVADQGRADGDRRRLRRQDPRLPRTRGRGPVAGRPAGR